MPRPRPKPLFSPGNRLLATVSNYLLAQQSSVMCAAARLVLQLPRKSHTSDGIHCQFQSMFISSCVFSCIHGLAPSYLLRYRIPVSSIAGRSHLCSAASGDLFIPTTNTVNNGPQAFANACPAAWNSLPTELHDISKIRKIKVKNSHIIVVILESFLVGVSTKPMFISNVNDCQ